MADTILAPTRLAPTCVVPLAQTTGTLAPSKITGLGPFYAANSGAVGTVNASASTSMDHSSLLQTFINQCSTTVAALSSFCAAIIDFPPLCYRVQNLTLPGNVRLRLNGARLIYVDPSLSPSTGPGNYVVRMYGSLSSIESGHISGNGPTQSWIGGIWFMPAGAAGVGTAVSSGCRTKECTFDQLGGRAVFDQGVANRIQIELAENTMLSATNLSWFMGAVEQSGTDGWLTDSEFGPSVTTVSNGVAVPRSPTIFDFGAISTLNGGITLPLSNGTITLASTASASTTGGVVSIGGHQVTYQAVSGATLTGCYCSDSATVSTGTSVIPLMGYVASMAVGGANNWSTHCVAEFGDIGLHLGNSTLAQTTASAALTTSGVGTVLITVDSTAHLSTAGGTLTIPALSSGVVYSAFIYSSISETTVSSTATITSAGQSLAVASTSGWPSSGTLNAGGYKLTYTSIVDATHLGGVSVASGTASIVAGAYARSNALNGCYVTAGTLSIANNASVAQYSSAANTKMVSNRIDFARGPSVVMTNGTGQLISVAVLSGAASAKATYDAWHAPGGGLTAYKCVMPSCSTVNANTYKWGILDSNASGTQFSEYINPNIANCAVGYFTSDTAGAWFTLSRGPGVQSGTNSTTLFVSGISDIVTSSATPTTVTVFSGGVNGQDLTVLQDSKTTIQNNATIVTKSGSDIAPPSSGYALLRFKRIGYGTSPTPAWYQY